MTGDLRQGIKLTRRSQLNVRRVAVARMVFVEVIANALQVRCGGGCPAYPHL